MGFPSGSNVKESTFNVGDLSLSPGLGSSPGDGNGYPLWYSFWPAEVYGQRSLAGYSPRVRKELDMSEQLSHTHTQTHKIIHVKTFYILVSNIMEWSVSKETSKSGD